MGLFGLIQKLPHNMDAFTFADNSIMLILIILVIVGIFIMTTYLTEEPKEDVMLMGGLNFSSGLFF
jgi:hypothetical protein